MKKAVVSLVVFAVVTLLTSALSPPEKENGERKGIAGADDKKFLSKRKPPGKVPGPQLLFENDKPEIVPNDETSLKRSTEEKDKSTEEEEESSEEKNEGKERDKKDLDKTPMKTFKKKTKD